MNSVFIQYNDNYPSVSVFNTLDYGSIYMPNLVKDMNNYEIQDIELKDEESFCYFNGIFFIYNSVTKFYSLELNNETIKTVNLNGILCAIWLFTEDAEFPTELS